MYVLCCFESFDPVTSLRVADTFTSLALLQLLTSTSRSKHQEVKQSSHMGLA